MGTKLGDLELPWTA